tara:strand:- start:4814 stop:5839 length:1026 start_codon:yes stop_codon:yes gene_type:complete
MIKHDKKMNLLFVNWLTITLILIFIMIIVGGLTRLTGSGLSITEWELFKGILPPLSNSSWEKYFNLYKEIPQFKLLNSNMSLEEFKVIFYWEYFHRVLGRVIGLFFLLPFLYFFILKKIDKKFFKPCLTVLFLILLQGFVGWYMVKSGLVNNVSVSHYRLSLHLSLALIIISIIFWLILNIKRNSFKNFFQITKDSLPIFLIILLIFSQIILGAFVSGLDAGKIYQTWPLMDQSYIPGDLEIKHTYDLFDFNNHSLIQFYHRNLAYVITLCIAILGMLIFINKVKKLYKPLFYVFLFISLQVFLGIFTLISGLNMYLASAHQICSVLLVFSSINLYYYHIK